MSVTGAMRHVQPSNHRPPGSNNFRWPSVIEGTGDSGETVGCRVPHPARLLKDVKRRGVACTTLVAGHSRSYTSMPSEEKNQRRRHERQSTNINYFLYWLQDHSASFSQPHLRSSRAILGKSRIDTRRFLPKQRESVNLGASDLLNREYCAMWQIGG